MKLKKILLPIFIGVALLMASAITAVSGMFGAKNSYNQNLGAIELDLQPDILSAAENSSYTIAFDAKGGLGSMNNQTFEYGKAKSLSSNAFEKEGCTFAGWTTVDYDLTTVPEIEYSDCATIKNLTNTDGETIILYAVWVSEGYTARIYEMGVNGIYAGGYISQILPATAGSIVDVEKEAVKLEMLVNKGLQLDKVTDIEGNTITTANIDNDNSTILCFYFKRPYYTVTFATEGGKMDEGTRVYALGEAYGQLPVPTKRGYTFANWVTREETSAQPLDVNTVSNTKENEVNSTSVMGIGNQTLYATYTANKYKVTLDAQGGSVNNDIVTVTFDQPYGNLPNPSNLGYKFEGWQKVFECEGQSAKAWGTEFANSDTVISMLTANTQYYLEYDVTINEKFPYQHNFSQASQWGQIGLDCGDNNYLVGGIFDQIRRDNGDFVGKTYHVSTTFTTPSNIDDAVLVWYGGICEAYDYSTYVLDGEISNITFIEQNKMINNQPKARALSTTTSTDSTLVTASVDHTLMATYSTVEPTIAATVDTNSITYGLSAATFTASATHELTISYQWHRSTVSGFTPNNGTLILGATSSTYTHDTKTTNAGTYYYTCVASVTYSDSGTTLTAYATEMTLVVEKADNIVNMSIEQGLEYNGNEQILAEVNDIDNIAGNIYYKIGTELTSSTYTQGSTSLPTGADAGTYNIYFYIPASTNYKALSGKIVNKIAKTANIFEVTVYQDLEYNTQEQLLLEAFDIDGINNNIHYSINSEANASSSTELPRATNAGTYKVYYYVPETDNYLEASGSNTVVIRKTENNFEINQNVPLIYNGQYQTLLTVTHQDPTKSVYYSVDVELTDGNFDTSGSTEYPQAKDAGTYTVYYFVEESDNFYELNGFSKITISPKGTTLTINPNGGVWNGSTESSSFEQNSMTTLAVENPARTGYTFNNWTFGGGYNGIYDGHTYELTGSNYYVLSDDYEYYDKYTVSVWAYHDTWTTSTLQPILSATNSGGWDICMHTDGAVKLCIMFGHKSGYEYISFGGGLEKGWHNFAYTFDGTYVKLYLDGNLANSFNCGSKTTIKEEIRNNPYILIGSECGWTTVREGGYFTGKIKNILLINEVYSSDTMSENSANAMIYEFGVDNMTLTANWEITPPTISISVDKPSIVYGQQTATFTANAIHESTKTYQWHCSTVSGFTPNSSTAISGATGETYINDGRAINAGTYYYKCVVTAIGVSATSNEVTFTVNKASNLVEVMFEEQLTYNGTAQTLLTVIDSDGIDNNIHYSINSAATSSSSTNIPTATNAGIYNVYYYIPATDNYYEVSGMSTIAIVKADNLLSVTTYKGLQFNGTDQQLLKVEHMSTSSVWYKVYDAKRFTGTMEALDKDNYKTDGTTNKPTGYNSGNYVVYIYIPADDNYNEIVAVAENRISALQTTLTINPNGGKWNNSETPSSFSGNDADTQLVADPTRTGATFTGWTFTNGGESYFDDTTNIFTFDLDNITMTAQWDKTEPTITIDADQNEIIYNTNSATLTATAVHPLDKTYQWYRSTTSGFEPSDATLIAGATSAIFTHTPTLTSTGTYYYKCIVSVDFGDEVLTATSNEEVITVTKNNNTLQIRVSQGLVYNGQAQVLLEIKDSDETPNNVHYNIGSAATTSSSTDLPTGINAGTYNVYYLIPETNNYNAMSGVISVEIAKADNALEVKKYQDLKYNGTAQTLLEVTDSDGIDNNVYYKIVGINETVEFTDSNCETIGTKTYPAKTNAGDYNIYFYVPSTTNYNSVSGNAIVSIAMIENTLELTIAQNLVYNGNNQTLLEARHLSSSPTYYNIGSEVNDSNKTDDMKNIPQAKLDGTYTVYYYIPADTNYYGLSGYADVVIAPKYTTLTINPNGGEWNGFTTTQTYNKKNGETLTIPDPTFDGCVFAGWTIEGTAMFTDKVYTFDVNDITMTATWTEVQPTITIATDKNELTYGLHRATLTATAVHPLDKTYQWYRSTTSGFEPSDTTLIAGATSETFVHTEKMTDVGTYYYKCIVSVSVGGNTLTATSNEIQIQVVKSENTLQVHPSQNLVYNGTAQILATATDNDGIDNNIYYNIGSMPTVSDEYKELPTAVDAGSYEVYILVPETANYKSISASVTVVILKAENTLQVKAAQNLIYNGQPQVLVEVTDSDGIDNNIYYNIGSAANDTHETDYPTGTNAGSYNVYYFVPETDNYNSVSGDVTVEIGKAENTLQIHVGLNLIYNGQLQELMYIEHLATTATYYNIGAKVTDDNKTEAMKARPQAKDVDTYEVFYYIPDDGNYYEISGSIEVAINSLMTTLTINPNGGQWNETTENSTITQANGTTYTVGDATREGYTFAGWEFSNNAEYFNDSDNLFTFELYDVTMTASWAANDYTVTLDAQGGTVTPSTITVTYTQPYGEIPTPTRDGYSFDGWYLNEELTGNAIISSTTVQTIGDHTLYAAWERDDYIATFDYQGGTTNFTNGLSGTFEFSDEDESNEITDEKLYRDWSAGSIDVVNTAFNGTHSMRVKLQTVGANDYNRRIGIINTNQTGSFKALMYVMAESDAQISIYAQEQTNWETFGDVQYSLSANTWTYLETTFTNSVANGFSFWISFENVGVNYYIDDIKIVRTDAYTPVTSAKYNIQTTAEESLLPYPAKAGYTFIGWSSDKNAKAGDDTFVTSYGDGKFGNVTYYAIYELSRPTAIASVDKSSIEYKVENATLTATVTTEGISVDSKSYQWYVATTSDFSDEQIITGATQATYTSTLMDCGTYYYRCVVSVTKGGVTTATTTSNPVSVTVTPTDNEISIAMEGYTYNDETLPQPTITNPNNTTYTIYYNEEGSTEPDKLWSEVSSTTTLDIGNYYMYALTDATQNYKATKSNVVEFTVSPATIILSFIGDNDATKVVDGNNVTYTSVYDANGLTVKLGPTNVDATISYWVGTGTKTTELVTKGNLITNPIKFSESGEVIYNYEVTADNYATITGTITLRINLQSVAVVWDVADSYTYNGTDQSANVKAYIVGVDGSNIDCVVSFSGQDTVFKNAGTYTATASLDDANYTLTNTTIELVMNKLAVTVTAEDKSMIYGAAAPDYEHTTSVTIPTVDNDYTTDYTLNKITVVEGGTQTDDVTGQESTLPVGTYKIVPTSNLSTDNYILTYVEGTLTITSKEVAVVWTVADSYTYNGTDQGANIKAHIVGVSGNVDCVVTFSGQDTVFKNAGTYTATASLANANYTLTNTTIELVMNKFDITITADNQTMSYLGVAPTYTYKTEQITPDSYNVTYKLFNNTTDVTGQESTLPVGTYTITPSSDLNTNYNVTYVNGTLTITNKQVAVQWNVENIYTYDGTDQGAKVIASVPNVGVCTIVFSGQDTVFKDAGTYTATASIDNANYTLTNTTIELVMNKLDITVTADNKEMAYGSAAPTYTYTPSLTAPDSYNVTYKLFNNTTDVTGTESELDVGTYTITPSSDLNDNYNVTYANGTLTIVAKEVAVVWTVADSYTYDGTDQGAKVKAHIVGVNGNVDCVVSFSGQDTVFKNAGTYTATASLANANYTLTNTTKQVVMGQFVISITADNQTMTYGDTAPSYTYEANVASTPDTFTVTYTLNDGENDVTGQESTLNIGEYTITPHCDLSSSNYDITYINGVLTVEAKEVAVVWTVADSYTYDGTDQGASVKAHIVGVSGNVDCVVSFSGQNTTFKNAGTYTATASLANANYTLTNTTKQVVMNRFAITITADNQAIDYGAVAPTYTYKTEQTAPDSYNVTYKLFNDKVDVTGQESTLAIGTYTITPSSDLNANYNVTYVNGTLTIKAQSAEVVWTVTDSYTYNGADQSASVKAHIVGVNGNIDCVVTFSGQSTTFKDAGDYVATANLDDDNYTLVNATKNLTINTFDITITADNQQMAYGSAAPSYAYTPSLTAPDSYNVTYKLFNNTTDVTGTESELDVGTYTITPSSDLGANYNVTYANGTLTIVAKEVAVVWTVADSYTYDGTDQGAKVKAHIVGVSGNVDCVVSFSGQDTVFKNAGTYTATASLDDTNYTLTNTTKQVVMGQFVISITADNKTMTYGDTAPSYTYKANVTPTPDTFTVTYTLNDGENDVTGQESTLNIGEYTITPHCDLSSSNYDITYINGVLTVEAKKVTDPSIKGTYTYNSEVQQVELNNFDDSTMAIVSGDTGEDAGDYTLVIKLVDATNYTWSDGTSANLELVWTIEKYDLSNATIAEIATQTYTGSAITPEPIVTALGDELVKATDFTYSYTNNTNVGTATVSITAVDTSNYKGSKSVEFTISAKSVEIPVATGDSPVYDSTEKTANIATNELYTITNNRQTNAGTYYATVTLKDAKNYVWSDNTNTSKQVEWEILKADITLGVANSSMTIRVGESKTNVATITLGYSGNLNGRQLTVSGAEDSAVITTSYIDTNNQATITVMPTKSTSAGETIRVQYLGDANHNASNVAEFVLQSPAITVEIVVHNNVGGTGVVNGVIAGTTNEVKLNSDITFTAQPDANYGLIKYQVANNAATYITESDNLTADFTSSAITINEALIGSGTNEVTITITLYFDKVVTVAVDPDKTSTNAIDYTLNTKYEDVNVAHIYNNNELTMFESSVIDMILNAKVVEGQYYVVNKVTIGDITENRNAINSNIYATTEEVGSGISVTMAKVFNADTRTIYDNGTAVATVGITPIVEDDIVLIGEDEIQYVVENSNIDFVITKTNSEYDLLAIDIGESRMPIDQKNQTEWDIDTANNTMTWLNRTFSHDMATAQPVLLHRWYEVDDTDDANKFAITIDPNVNAKLTITDIGYSYNLADDIFSEGRDALYAGTWKVEVVGDTSSGYVATIKVYTSATEYTSYNLGDTFTIDSSVTKVEISIVAQ